MRWASPKHAGLLGISEDKARAKGWKGEPGSWTWADPVQYQIVDTTISVWIDLIGPTGRFDERHEWFSRTNGTPRVQRRFICIGRNGPRFDIQLRIDARPSPRVQQTVKIWLDRMFVSGGLPTLGKRR